MPKSIYDTAVIGAGVAGVTVAKEMYSKKVDLILIDKSSYPATGGSGAAGAFVAPKIGKGGDLQDITNSAFDYAFRYYKENYSHLFRQTGILRVPRDDKDLIKFDEYARHNYKKVKYLSNKDIQKMGFDIPYRGFFFPDAGDCDAPDICRAIAKGIPFLQSNINSIKRVGDMWLLEGSKSIMAKRVILATGYQNNLLPMEYMGIKGLWGSRGDYITTKDIPTTIHQKFTISATKDNRVFKMGATHIKSKNPCIVCDGNPLKELESKTIDILHQDIKPLRYYCGMRAGSRDFFPVVGKVVDTQSMLKEYPSILKGYRCEPIYHKDIYIINGLGGRGFVLAPLMAKWLCEAVLEHKSIDERVNPDRLFWRWVRKQHNRYI